MKILLVTVISVAVIAVQLYTPSSLAQPKKLQTTRQFVYKQKEFRKQWKEVQEKYPLVGAALKESTLLNLDPKQIGGRKQLGVGIDSRLVGIRVDPVWRATYHSCVAFLTGIGGVSDSCDRFVDPPRCFCPPPLICLQAGAFSPERDACFDEIDRCEERCLEGPAQPKKLQTTRQFVYKQKEFRKQWKEVQEKYPLVGAALKESTLLNLDPKQIGGRKQLGVGIDSRLVGIRVDPVWRATYHSCVAFLTGIGGVSDSCDRFVDPPRCFCPPPLICLQAGAFSPERDACFDEIDRCEERCLEGPVPPHD